MYYNKYEYQTKCTVLAKSMFYASYSRIAPSTGGIREINKFMGAKK